MHPEDTPLPTLPRRDPQGHKGTFGTVAIIGGNAGSGGEGEKSRARMFGGPALSAIAALRAGAGLVRLVMPAPTLDAGLVVAPSATGLAIPVDSHGAIIGHEGARIIDELSTSADCLAIGPGLGAAPAASGAASAAGYEGVHAMCLRAVAQVEAPVVVDADALNNLADIPGLREDFRAPAVLTPHPGEFRRLARALGLGAAPGSPIDPTNESTRPAACAALAQTLGCVVILKGARTIVSDGHRSWRNEGDGSGADNPALATAGSGDVLTGLLAALIAWLHPRREQRNRVLLEDLAKRALAAKGSRLATAGAQASPPPEFSLFDCARLAVRAHALGASLWRERHGSATAGLLAPELTDLLPEALERMRG